MALSHKVSSVAALYDVHGNLPALEAVLAELDDVDAIVVGGDVAAGPWPSETVERLRALGDRVLWLRGNADRELVERDRQGKGPRELLAWIRERLSDEQLAFLERLSLTQTVEVEGLGRMLFCHATPRSDEEVLTGISPSERWIEAVAGSSEDVVVCGHTHVQFDRTADGVRIVNAGSVGMPYEREPGAYWLRLGPDVEHRRTDYDVESAARAIAATGWPEEWPVAPPEEATEFFERLYVAERVPVGIVGKPHGLGGAFVVDDASEDPAWFEVGRKLLVGQGEVEVLESKRARGRPVIRVDRRVERGTVLEVARASLPPTGEDEYYVFQLVGLEVEEEDGRSLGRVTDVSPGVANDVLELDSGLSLPMVEECIRSVDLDQRRIVVARGFSDPG